MSGSEGFDMSAGLPSTLVSHARVMVFMVMVPQEIVKKGCIFFLGSSNVHQFPLGSVGVL